MAEHRGPEDGAGGRGHGLLPPLLLAGLVVAVLPFAAVPLGPHPGFLPAFFAVLCLCELATAAVLVAQFRATRRLPRLGLAVAYGLSGLLVVPHALAFPGVAADRGLWPGEPALATWLWVAWHLVFPIGLAAAAALPDVPLASRRALPAAVGLVAVLVVATPGGLVLLQPVLPTVIAGDDYGRLLGSGVGVGVLAVSTLTLALTARRRAWTSSVWRWILLASSASLADALLTLVAHERFTVGWYAGRVSALAASAIVLVALLREVVRLQNALSRSNARLAFLLESTVDAYLAVGQDDRVEFANPQAEALLHAPAHELVGRPLAAVLPEELAATLAAELAPLSAGEQRVAFDAHDARTDAWLAVRAWHVGELTSIALHDVTERRRAEERLAHQALHDPLTGLPNRVLLLERLEHALARRRRDRGRCTALLFVDLDGFKPVNDALGHEAGDVVLGEVARRLVALVRPADTVARLGGDEFCVLCEDLPSREDAEHVARRVREAVARPVAVGGREVAVSASVGVAAAESGREDPAVLLRDADAAMYRAKAAEHAARFARPRRAAA